MGSEAMDALESDNPQCGAATAVSPNRDCVAVPLLRFTDGQPALQEPGLALLWSLRRVSTVAFIGDGRCGKSFLADHLARELGLPEGTFRSAGTAEPVTEGMDVAAVAIDADLSLVIFDCEGGGNAQAPIRTAIAVLGALAAQQVVYVVGGQVAEAQLQSLGASVAVRALLHGAAETLPRPSLHLVVNKKDPTLAEQDLEELLREQHAESSRNELRASVKAGFGARRLHAVPFAQMPEAFSAAWRDLREALLGNAIPIEVAGVAATGGDFAALLQRTVEQLRRDGHVSLPDVHRHVLFENFLRPLVMRRLRAFCAELPFLGDEYVPRHQLRDPRERLESEFRQETARIAQPGSAGEALAGEALAMLRSGMRERWEAFSIRNDDVGKEVACISSETREVFIRSEGVDCFSDCSRRSSTATTWGFPLVRKVYRVESRTRIVRKHGGPPEYSEWEDTGREVFL